MRNPGFGEANQGAMAGLVVGSIGGLFAIGVAHALVRGNISFLIATPKLSLLSWVISGPVGWLVGGQLGPRLGEKFNSPRAEIIGGALGGLVPVLLLAAWGWYMAAKP